MPLGTLWLGQDFVINFSAAEELILGKTAKIWHVWVLSLGRNAFLSFRPAVAGIWGGLGAGESSGAPMFCNGLYRNKYCCSLLP